MKEEGSVSTAEEGRQGGSSVASADGESRVTAVSVEASGAGWGQTGRSLGRADIGLSWWEGLDCSGRKGQWRKTIRWRRWAGKWAGTGGKWTDRGGARAGEDGGYGREGIGTGERAGEQARRWRQVEASGGGLPEEAAAEAVAEAGGSGGGAPVEHVFGWRRRIRGRAGYERSERGKRMKEEDSVSAVEEGQQGGSSVASADGESRVTVVLIAASGAGWGQTVQGLGGAGIGRSWWGGLDFSGRKGRRRNTIRWRKRVGKRAGTGGKWADRGGARVGEDGGYGITSYFWQMKTSYSQVKYDLANKT